MKINFECKKCKEIFDCDIGKFIRSKKTSELIYENQIICPKCGILETNQYGLTKLGTSQSIDARMQAYLKESEMSPENIKSDN